MPDGYRSQRFGRGGRVLFAAIVVSALCGIGLSAYVWWTQTIVPERGSAGPVTANSPGRNPPSTVRSRPQQ